MLDMADYSVQESLGFLTVNYLLDNPVVIATDIVVLVETVDNSSATANGRANAEV